MDVFEFGEEIATTVLLFGGTGIDEEEYQERKASVIPLFNSEEDYNLGHVRIVYATSPFDIPFVRFGEFPSELVKWNRHLLEDIFERWKDSRFWVSSFSGSASLVLSGIERDKNCIGAAVLAPDELKPSFCSPKHWRDRLVVFTSPYDRVCSHPENQLVVETLVKSQEAREVEVSTKSHSLFDYMQQAPILNWLRSLTQ